MSHIQRHSAAITSNVLFAIVPAMVSGSANPAAAASEVPTQNTREFGNGARVTCLHSAASALASAKETVEFLAVVAENVLLLAKWSKKLTVTPRTPERLTAIAELRVRRLVQGAHMDRWDLGMRDMRSKELAGW